ncbi:MAG: nuclear transport factor 2 family protein [Cytophagales bacterium]|nr:nuclear transport factor 2 family protein [Cytophagales bacterium]
MDEVITPLNVRLSKKIVPTVRRLYADGDWVVALWEGKATARDGKPYSVTYSWHMRLAQGRIVEVIAFLDTLEFADIMSRVPAKDKVSRNGRKAGPRDHPRPHGDTAPSPLQISPSLTRAFSRVEDNCLRMCPKRSLHQGGAGGGPLALLCGLCGSVSPVPHPGNSL